MGPRRPRLLLRRSNCGIGFAPCRPADRTQLIDILVSVEDIPGTALHEGIRWSWTTFPEYLDSLSATQTVFLDSGLILTIFP